MAETAIEWTDRVWNPVAGCTPVSPGCLNCYAARMAVRLEAMEKPGYMPRRLDAAGRDGTGRPSLEARGERPVRIVRKVSGRPVFTGDVRTLPERLGEPLKWRKPCRVFVNSMSDLFHEAVPFEFVDQVVAVMALCRQHTFQVLTKRPERMAEYFASGDLTRDETTLPSRWMKAAYEMAKNDRGGRSARPAYVGLHIRYHRGRDGIWPLENVWLGTSVENQAAADERIPHLLRCPAVVRFLSCEPLLGAISFRPRYESCVEMLRAIDRGDADRPAMLDGIDWVIAGGESGPGSRPSDLTWYRSLRDQCRAAGVAYFQKQLGARVFDGVGRSRPTAVSMNRSGSPCTHAMYDDGGSPETWPLLELRDPKGGDPAEWPEDLRVREMPEVQP